MNHASTESARNLVLIPFPVEAGPLPPAAAELSAAAAPRIKEYEWGEQRVAAFVASNPNVAHSVLDRLLDGVLEGRRFCEWGSGYGIVTGMAALLGYEATGIEIEPRLVRDSRDLLEKHGIEARIVLGSYYAPGIHRDQPDAAALEKELGFAPWDFDVVYAYPWPAEAEMLVRQFGQFARPGAHLVTFLGGVDLQVYRQEAGPSA